MPAYQVFHDAISEPAVLAQSIKKKQKKIIGYLCSYAPVELIHAAGFHPMRLFSSKADISLAENHLQAYCCSLVRGVLEDSLSGYLDFLDGTVFPHTCDSIQRLSDIWRMKVKYEFFADVGIPTKLNTQSARIYMADVLAKFRTDLETALGSKIDDAQLSSSIAAFNQVRRNLKKLYVLRSQKPGVIKGSDMHAIIKASMLMEPLGFAGLLTDIIESLEKENPPDNTAKRFMLAGSLCDFPEVYTVIENAGGVVVADDLCTGFRWLESETSEDGDPMAALTQRYFERITCPAKHQSTTARGDGIVRLAKSERVDGVIFMHLKFCDPHAFDYPYIKDFLNKVGIKSILVEMDDQVLSQGQLATRLETFVHML